MILNATILFISALLGGLSIYVFGSDKIDIKNLLIFAGAYLFSVTVIHILPELFHASETGFSVGLAVLSGFFFQHVLEYFTSGVEHGHMHHHPERHSHSRLSGLSLMIALCLHAFLEGSLIAYPEVFGETHKVGSLLFGVVLHKVPAALALMTVLSCQFSSNKTKNEEYHIMRKDAVATFARKREIYIGIMVVMFEIGLRLFISVAIISCGTFETWNSGLM